MTLGVPVAICPEAVHLRFSQQMLRCMDGWADGQVDGWVDSEMSKMLRGKLKKKKLQFYLADRAGQQTSMREGEKKISFGECIDSVTPTAKGDGRNTISYPACQLLFV